MTNSFYFTTVSKRPISSRLSHLAGITGLKPLATSLAATLPILSAIFLTSHASAEPVQQLETMTVTAERFPVQEREIPRFVTVITSEELSETGANNLIDALKRTGGLTYKSYGPLGISHGGMNSTLSIRGIKDGEIVLINGSPVQGAAGHAYDLNAIPIDQIERIEVLKGASSTLYGADAMSGVINIITKKPGTKQSVSASAEVGDDFYQHHFVSASVPGAIACDVGLDYQHLGAQREISRSFTKKYRYDLDQTERYAWNLNLQPKSLSDHLFFDYLGSFLTTGFQKHYDANKPAYEGTDQSQTKHFASLRYETDDLKLKLFGNHDLMERDPYTTPKVFDDENSNYNYGIEGDYKFEVASISIQTGAEWVYRGADYNNQYGSHYRNDYAAFFQAKKAFTERFSATLGIREQLIDAESGTKDHDQFLPSIGISYKLSDQFLLFADAGKAFRAPTFNNLYYQSNFMVGNPELGPEEGWTYEAGIKCDTDIFRLRLAGFYMDYSDKIEIDRSKSYPLTYFNATDYTSTGIEWKFSVTPFVNHDGALQNIMLRTSGYLADPTAQDTAGKEYQTGAKLQTSFGIGYVTEAVLLDLNYQLIASRERQLDSYGILNMSARYAIGKGYLKLAVDNIFDEKELTTGEMTEGSINQYGYYETGRLAKVGYEIRF